MMGQDATNPVIIYLHGGPAGLDTFMTYAFSDYLTDEYTFIGWDQRGCGRTYFKNQEKDPNNETVSFDQALDDLDALVNYACDRFGQDKVIIMGHSYGTTLGSTYVKQHPEKVQAYIGIGQLVSIEDADIYITMLLLWHKWQEMIQLIWTMLSRTSAINLAFQHFLR